MMPSQKQTLYWKQPDLIREVSRLQGSFKAAVGNDQEALGVNILEVLFETFEQRDNHPISPQQSLANVAASVADIYDVRVKATLPKDAQMPIIEDFPHEIMDKLMHGGLGEAKTVGRARTYFENFQAKLEAAP